MPEKVNPEQLLVEGLADAEEGENELDPIEYIAVAVGEILEQGLPIRVIKDAHNFLHPVTIRLQKQNEILADISASLRVLAKLKGAGTGSGLVSKLSDEVTNAEIAKK